ALIQNYIDPTSTSSGVLGGQIVALKLNVNFNSSGYLGANPVPLGDLVIKNGPFTGWTVNSFLSFAEQALGGGPLNGFSYSQINDAATSINENFENGNVNKGYLDCAENVYGKIGDFVWFDVNENGLQDPDENGIPNVHVKLFSCNDVLVDSTTTDLFGKYNFSNIAPGSYYVKFDLPDGYQFTIKDAGDDNFDSDVDLISGKTACFTLSPGETILSIDAGMYYLKATLGDMVWFDQNENGIQDLGESGIPNILIKLFDCSDNFIDSTKTDGNGNYLFGNIRPGNYYIMFIPPDTLKFTSKDQGIDDLVDSDANILTGKTDCITLLPNEHNLSVDAGLVYKRSSIGDFIWNDLNMNGLQESDESGFAGVIVKLYDCSENYLTQTLSDSLGYYSFNNLLPGNYKIEVILPVGYQFSPTNQGNDETKDSDVNPSTGQSDCIILGPDQNYTNLDAGIHLIPPPPVCSIGDKIWLDANMNGIQDANETGVANVLVKLFDCNGVILDSTFTNYNGNYSFDSLVAGQYKIKVKIPEGFSFSPKDVGNNDLLDSDIDPVTGESVCIVLNPQNCGENDVKWDVGIYPTPPTPTCVIGDKVWEDLNKNGIQDNGEPGVGYVTVKLLDCNHQVLYTTQTDNNGFYHFNNIPAGNYKLRFVLPQGYVFTTKDVGTNDLIDSDVDTITGMSVCFTVEPPNCDSNSIKWDAGIYKLKGSIGDFVWFDSNNNGIQDAGETGVAGITVKLYDC
ncbi:MAG: SdrD B-like domain-containing protein, partial [Ignavibacteria bacterium]